MPVLNLNSKIFFFDACKSLGTTMNPVYLLTAYDNSVIVIKREGPSTSPLDLKYNLKVVKAVNPAARGKLLDPQEIVYIKDCVDTHERLALKAQQPVPADLASLKAALNAPGVWFKMEEVKELTNLKKAALELQNNADKGPIRKFAAALNAKGGLESLGEVVAIDLYNHNSDRFTPRLEQMLPPRYDQATKYGGKQPEFGGKTFLVLVNVANVMVGVDGGSKKAVALDSFDPFSGGFSDVAQTIEQLERTGGGCWFGRMLTAQTHSLRELYAQDIVHDLEDLWGPRNRKILFAKTTRLDSKAARRIVNGMEAAIPKIKQKLEALMRKYGSTAPAGLQSRYNILNT